MVEDMRPVHLTRRRAVLAVLLLGALVELTAAIAVMGGGGDKATAAAALPLHPVAGNFKVDDTKVEDCTAQRCKEQAFGNIAFKKGPQVALARFRAYYGDFSDPGCHRVAHAIGSASLARNKGDVARTFGQGSSDCFSGYYHGVLERSLLSVKSYDADALGEVIRGLCGAINARKSLWLMYQCLHGLGHGLMITTGYTLPLSLKVCDRLSTDWQTTSCNGGAFMENISTLYGYKSRWLKDDDAVYPCNSVAQEDKIKCYEIVTSRILRTNGGSWEKTSETCAAVEKGWVAACFRSLGRDTAGQAHQNPVEIRRLCGLAQPFGGEGTCLKGAAMAMTGNFKNGERAARLCDSAAVGYRMDCYDGIGSVMVLYGPTAAKREADCRSITGVSSYVAACVRGGNAYFRWASEQ
jgi:hypothetical protein